jgi:predicted alpha/beta superfamily hydrolase
VRYHHVNSESVGRGYHVYVRLPAGYDETDREYPTVYLLDGGNTFPMLAPYYQYLYYGEEVPELMLVGISYGSDDFEDGNLRSTDFTAPSAERDYWGGASKFQAFLADELLPVIENGYRSDPEQRVIFGQSLGGQFVLFTAQTRPGLFYGYIASNPSMHRNLDFFLGTEPAETSGSKLFVGSGTEDDPAFREPARTWIAHWTARPTLPWELRTVDLEGHSHMSAPPAAFRQGLVWIFGDRANQE